VSGGDRDAVLQLAADVVRPVVLTEFAADSCIATSRVLIEVLRRLNIPARPWAVNLLMFNPAGWDLYQDGIPVREWPADAWSVGFRGDRPGEVGHVAVVAGARLIDASLDQAARPDRGMPPIPPTVFALPAGIDLDRADQGLVYQAGPTRLVYAPSGSRLYASSSNWRRDHPAIRACVAEAVRGVQRNGIKDTLIPASGGGISGAGVSL
jgi:hypothetical protein